MKRKVIFTTIGIVWSLTLGLGLKSLWDYAAAAGEPATPPSHWPVDCRIKPASDRATLVLLAHPHCPCTRATIGELARIMARCKGQVIVYVAFYKPTDFGDEWERTDLWDAAAAIPDVLVVRDDDGTVARSFNAATSGQAVVYDARGELLFAGGITAARGHAGDNLGSDAVVALVTGQTPGSSETPVFGCPLFDRHSECNEGVQQCTR